MGSTRTHESDWSYVGRWTCLILGLALALWFASMYLMLYAGNSLVLMEAARAGFVVSYIVIIPAALILILCVILLVVGIIGTLLWGLSRDEPTARALPNHTTPRDQFH